MAASSRFSPPTGRPLIRTVVILVVGFVLLCAAVVAAGWVLTHPLKSITGAEDDVNLWLADQRTGTLTHVADVGTIVGETLTGLLCLAALGIVFAVWKRTWWPLVFVGVLDAGMGLFYLAGTELDPRQRPPVRILQSGLVPDASFPSGHTGTATVIAGVLAALLWAYTRVARWLLVLLVVIPAYTMLARLYIGAHYVSDVLIAFSYAGLWLLLCARMLLPGRAAEPHPGRDAGSPSFRSVAR